MPKHSPFKKRLCVCPSHILVLVLIPPPQSVVHGPYSPQGPHPPFPLYNPSNYGMMLTYIHTHISELTNKKNYYANYLAGHLHHNCNTSFVLENHCHHNVHIFSYHLYRHNHCSLGQFYQCWHYEYHCMLRYTRHQLISIVSI